MSNNIAEINEYDYILTFDGGADPNPGRGYGSYHLKTRKGKERLESRIQFGDNMTNNQAEYTALISGLADLVETIERAGKQPSTYSVRVWGDSNLVIQQLKGAWKVKDPKLEPLHRRALELSKRFKATSLNWHDRSNSVRLLGH
ncbi:MAG: ribonuclease HI family protein [Chloroflexi bacterium]|uniref:Ribonuclease HI family protein n=1 Tax=Candidatus Chlorohelix allophototropha TaxID=3003348 RepID=A0A8T7M0F9_9CHLR|nr:ribonuclease HI family protein [Chloroflexota bacterium]WJW67175.1 ribonuclease HI family protein [Chloroflexota bacterium L227-S17]